MPRILIRAILTSALIATVPLGSIAQAQDDDARARAREQFSLGVQRYEEGQYEAALDAFQEAYRLAPHPNVRVNMANCYERLGRPLEALHHYERFLAEAEGATAQQRREVQAAMRRLEEQLGSVRLSVTPDGARVTIDEAETRRAPILGSVRLTAGTHRVRVHLDGYRTAERQFEVRGGETQHVSIRLERQSDEPEVAATEPELAAEPAGDAVAADTARQDSAEVAGTSPAGVAEEPAGAPEPSSGGWRFRMTTPVIITGAATIAFALTAVATGTAAVIANDDFESAVRRSNDPRLSPLERSQARQDGLAAADLADTTSIVTDVFTIAAVAAGAATIFFVIVEGDAPADDTLARGPTLRLSAAPDPRGRGGAVTLQGRF